MAITSQELEYIFIIILIGGFATLIINALFNTSNLIVGVIGLLVVAYLFKLK